MRSRNIKFTPEIDALIIKTYQENYGDKIPRIRKLSAALNIPRWSITRRAGFLGAYTPLKKQPEWTSEELRILEKNAQFCPDTIRRKLKEKGYSRSNVAIVLKRKRMRCVSNLEGMSATMASNFFGVDQHWITDKIDKGLLEAERRLTKRTDKQGGDIFYIKENHLRNFIIKNPDLIDLRKVEKYYFIELLVNGGVHK